MHQEVWHAMPRPNRFAKRQRICQRAGVVVARVITVRLERLRQKLLLQPQPVEHADGVGRLLDSGAKAGEPPRLLIDGDAKSDPAQAGGSRQATDPGTNNGDLQGLFRHQLQLPAAMVGDFTAPDKRGGAVTRDRARLSPARATTGTTRTGSG